MRNLLALFGATVVTVVGMGWYLNWYNVRSVPAEAGKKAIHLDVDTTKIGADLKKGGEKAQTFLGKSRDPQTPSSEEPVSVTSPSEEKSVVLPPPSVPFKPVPVEVAD